VEIAGLAAGGVIGGEGVSGAIESEAGSGDAVAEAADGGTEERRAVEVGFDGAEAEDDIVELAGAVGHEEADEDAAEVGDVGAGAGVVLEGEEASFAAVGQATEGLSREHDRGEEG
jgi:hypothetical protein